jgi:hypothetical protein
LSSSCREQRRRRRRGERGVRRRRRGVKDVREPMELKDNIDPENLSWNVTQGEGSGGGEIGPRRRRRRRHRQWLHHMKWKMMSGPLNKL